jgi:hypothetical protein
MKPNLSKNVLWLGSERASQAAVSLRAGPLRLTFCDGVFRYIKLGEREILRAVYVAVRDESWHTVPGAISNLDIQSSPEAFTVVYDCAHRERDIDFRWTGRVQGNADASIVWRMEGEAYTSFKKNRIGICVLHPIAECAGQPCAIVHSDGTSEESRFPTAVAPHQPFLDVVRMRFHAAPGVDAEIAFAGEGFETEDQRNWTDTSFKTYSTPLSKPYPAMIQKGSTVRQSVSLNLRGAIPARTDHPRAEGELSFTLQPESRTPLPRIGLKDADSCNSISDLEVHRLAQLHLNHLSVDLEAGNPHSEESFWRSVAKAKQLSLPIEVAIAPTSVLANLKRILHEIARPKVEICRWLVDVQMQHPDLANELRELAAIAPVALGSGPNFAELNRDRPSSVQAGGVWFSLNPQVHASDDTTLIENLPAQSQLLESLREWAGAAPVTVSPVTLRPRMDRRANSVSLGAETDSTAPDADPRQASLFGAGWTLGSLKHLAEGGAASVTYYETSGPRGVMDAHADSPAFPGPVYPMYHVFSDVADFKKGEVIRTLSSDPLRADGIALIDLSRMRLILASFCSETVRIDLKLAGLATQAQLRQLDEDNAEEAMRYPEMFRGQSGRPLVEDKGSMRIELKPFALATVDAARNAHSSDPRLNRPGGCQ